VAQHRQRVRDVLAKQEMDGSRNVPPGAAENEGAVRPHKIYWTAVASLGLAIFMCFSPAYQQ